MSTVHVTFRGISPQFYAENNALPYKATKSYLFRVLTNCESLRPRYVPAFSIQSRQKNTLVVNGPVDTHLEKSAAGREENTESKQGHCKCWHRNNLGIRTNSSFRVHYDRGDLPIRMEYLTGGNKIAWTVDLKKLDFNLYLPLFFDGLSEFKHPYKTYARQGTLDLLNNGGDKICPAVPQLILPIKNALGSKNIEIMCTTLKIIQKLVMSSDMIGPALVPFYRQLLPVFNANRFKNTNCGDKIDYCQKDDMNLGDLIDETLQVLELHGGEDAFINIKYMVPTYESSILN